jgi:hypothetical protein
MKLMPGETWLLESYLAAWLNGDRREGTATEFVASEMIIRDRWGLTVKTLKNVCGNWEVQALRGSILEGASADCRRPTRSHPAQHRGGIESDTVTAGTRA